VPPIKSCGLPTFGTNSPGTRTALGISADRLRRRHRGCALDHLHPRHLAARRARLAEVLHGCRRRRRRAEKIRRRAPRAARSLSPPASALEPVARTPPSSPAPEGAAASASLTSSPLHERRTMVTTSPPAPISASKAPNFSGPELRHPPPRTAQSPSSVGPKVETRLGLGRLRQIPRPMRDPGGPRRTATKSGACSPSTPPPATPTATRTSATPTTQWKYRAIYRVDDDQVGLWSEERSAWPSAADYFHHCPRTPAGATGLPLFVETDERCRECMCISPPPLSR
jgi:hypothetical protein